MFRDKNTPTKRRKPANADHLSLRIIIAPKAYLDPDAAATSTGILHTRTERITRSPFTIDHNRDNAGLVASYFGRWCTRSGKPGPWSLPASMMIAVLYQP